MDEVILNILTSGNMGYPVRIFLGQIGKHLHLLRIEPAEGNFDPHHTGGVPNRFRSFGQAPGGQLDFLYLLTVMSLPIIVALTIDAATKTGFRKNPFIDFSLLPQLDLRFKDVNFPGKIRWHTPGQFISPRISSGHWNLLRTSN